MTDHPLTEGRAWDIYSDAHPVDAIRAAFDAGREHERTNPEDDRPWEPLNGGRVYVGDEVRRDHYGTTATAVVARVDRYGDPVTAEGGFIGPLSHGTWYVRRPLPELPTEPGAVIVANDGHEAITATLGSETYHAREAILFSADAWLGAWRDTAGARAYMGPTRITPGTWKVDGK